MTPATKQADRRDGAVSIDSALSRTGRATRYRLVIVGDNESEVVRAVGGLSYDWSSGGWDVVVHLAVPSDDRPLQILGARIAPLASLSNVRNGVLWPDAIIASSLVYRENLSVRDYFTRALLRSRAAIAMWGDEWPTGLGNNIGPVAYQLSPAARAFKQQAMLAAEVALLPPDSVEMLRGSPDRFTSANLPPFRYY